MSGAGGESLRLLVVGDAAVRTGFGRVMEGIFTSLAESFEIHHLGTNYDGDPHPYSWKVYPARLGGDTWGVRRLAELLERCRPHVVFILNDLWVHRDYLAALRQLPGGLAELPPVVLYTPIDAGPIDPEAIEPLAGVARFVVYTQFARGVVETAVAGLRQRQPDFAFPEIEIIPHGVDVEAFRPLDGGDLESGRREARRLLFPDAEDAAERFIVLNANRNQPRKRIDTTLRAFALFARDKPPSVKLFLHMGVEDLGWNVVQLARRYGVEDRVLMSGLGSLGPAVSDRQLNLIYNACEVGLNTSTGEGWGLASFEHAATRAAQVMPRHQALEELWDGAAVLVKPTFRVLNERILTEAALVGPEAVAGALEALYSDRAYLDRMAELAYQTALRPEYRWQTIADRWRSLFDSEARRRRPPGGLSS